VGVLTTKPGVHNYVKACQLIERTHPTIALTTQITPVRPTLACTATPELDTLEQPSGGPSTTPTINPDEKPSSDPTGEPQTIPTEAPNEDPDIQLNQDAPITVTFDGNAQEEEDVTQPHPEMTKDEEELMYWHLQL
jgi:hypothetical protein